MGLGHGEPPTCTRINSSPSSPSPGLREVSVGSALRLVVLHQLLLGFGFCGWFWFFIVFLVVFFVVFFFFWRKLWLLNARSVGHGCICVVSASSQPQHGSCCLEVDFSSTSKFP